MYFAGCNNFYVGLAQQKRPAFKACDSNKKFDAGWG